MLWRIADGNLWILASVHRAGARLDLKGQIENVLKNADIVGFECNFREYVPPPAIFRFKEGRTLPLEIPTSLYSAAAAAWTQRNGQLGDLDPLQPWAAALQIMNKELDSRGILAYNGVDHQVATFAHKHSKIPYFLEEGGNALKIWARTFREEQLVGLKLVAERIEESVLRVNAMADCWSNQDVAGLEAHLEQWRALQPSTAIMLIDQRNEAWLPRIVNLSRRSKSSVLVVGALHMVGEKALPKLLKGAGLRCEFIITPN